MIRPSVGDNITFTSIVRGKQKCGFRTDHRTGRAIATPEIPEQVLPQRGQGQVLGEIKVRKVNGTKYHTVRVAAGSPLGTVTAILDETAVLKAEQPGLFDMASSAPTNHTSMYDQGDHQ